MGDTMEDKITEIVQGWQENHVEGTIIFSSSHLLQSWEERLLESLGYLGGIHLALFAGVVESVTQARAEERYIEHSDQLYIFWGIVQNHPDLYPRFATDNPWYSTGMVGTICSVVRELKQAGIDQREVMEKSGCTKDLIALVEDYQETLNQLGMSDPDDALSELSNILSRGNGPEYLKRIITVGFQEFTSGQQRIIRLLERQGQVVHFNDEPSSEMDLIDLVEDLRKNGVEISGLTGSDREWEIRGIARAIRQKIELGEAPDQIAVVFRNTQQYQPYIKSIFSEYQIPWNEKSFFAWNKLPSFTSLCLGLRIFCKVSNHKDIWHLFNQYFSGAQGLLIDQWLTDEFKRTGKEKSLAEWAQWLREHVKGSSETLSEKIRYLADFIAKPLEMMPLAEYWRLGLEWLNTMNTPECVSDTQASPRHEEYILYSRAHYELVQAWDRWVGWTYSLGWDTIPISPEAFLSLIELLCAQQETTAKSSRADGVLVTTPSEVRRSEFSTVIIGGLVEGEFPRKPRRSTLIDENSQEKLRSMGYSIKSTDEYVKGERQTLLNLFRVAKKFVYLSCPTTENDGKRLSPSPFLLEIQNQSGIEGQLWPHYTPAQRLTLDPISPLECALKELTLKTSPFYHFSPETIACIQAEAQRRAGALPYKGFPGTFAVISKKMGKMFNNQYPFSPSAMKEYAHCPFGFFCKRVLRIEPVETPGPLPTPAELGSLYHEILKTFFENHKQALTSEDTDLYMQEILKIADEIFTEEMKSVAGDADLFALRCLQIESVKENLRLFLTEELHWQEKIGWRYLPAAFEVVFGGKEAGIELTIADGEEQIRLVGKIDRIDMRPDGKRFMILDYKTGNVPSHADIINGLDLQMPIYIMAAEEIFKDAEAGSAVYCSLKKHERNAGLWRKAWIKECGLSFRNGKEDDEWSALIDNSKKYLIQYGRSIRNGDFRPTLGECASYCSYRSVCRRAFTGGLEDEAE
ncbi:MAG TPA: PD-(D/E)XK nuclease family protein [Bacillota bacterium]|nr:PD-(D/E)XK nuclease family protein [Bacillota bacterium]